MESENLSFHVLNDKDTHRDESVLFRKASCHQKDCAEEGFRRFDFSILTFYISSCHHMIVVFAICTNTNTNTNTNRKMQTNSPASPSTLPPLPSWLLPSPSCFQGEHLASLSLSVSVVLSHHLISLSLSWPFFKIEFFLSSRIHYLLWFHVSSEEYFLFLSSFPLKFYIFRKWSFSSNSERLLDWKTGWFLTYLSCKMHFYSAQSSITLIKYLCIYI